LVVRGLLEHLNRHVYGGTNAGPIRAGINHFGRYASEPAVVLRIPTASLDANSDLLLFLARQLGRSEMVRRAAQVCGRRISPAFFVVLGWTF
jgi:hypothetical protein